MSGSVVGGLDNVESMQVFIQMAMSSGMDMVSYNSTIFEAGLDEAEWADEFIVKQSLVSPAAPLRNTTLHSANDTDA